MKIDQQHEFIIIGGGVAGLCAAIELCGHAIKPIVIEAGDYPTHKVCGEFLSPESISWLEALKIAPVPISEVHFYSDAQVIHFTFPQPAGSLSHWTLDPALVKHAKSCGATVLTQTKVVAFHPKKIATDPHILELSTGETVSAFSIIVAAGRLSAITPASTPSTGPSQPPQRSNAYVGVKAHFEGIELHNSLKMFAFDGAYLGLSPVEGGKANLACLATAQRAKEAGSIDQLMANLIATNRPLQALLSSGTRLFDAWMSAPIPFFGFKETPRWPDAYFIGDAALSIPPACGEGLSLAMTSGILAARYAAKKDYLGFKKDFHAWCKRPMSVAKGLNYALMHPRITKLALQGCRLCPSVTRWLFHTSRHSSLPH